MSAEAQAEAIARAVEAPRVKVRFFMDGLTAEQRNDYRVLRKFGFTREQANLVVFGMVVQSGGGDVSVAFLERVRIR